MFNLSKPKYYNSIDEVAGLEGLPVFYWFRINETNDLKWLIISGKPSEQQLIESWGKIFSEFLDTFGVSTAFKAILQLQKEITVLKINNALGDGKSNNVFIKIKEEELKKKISVTNANNINEINTHLKRFLGYNIDQKNTSVKEYYTDLNTFLKSNTNGNG